MSNTCTSVRHIDQLDKTNQPGIVLCFCFSFFPNQHQKPKKMHCKKLEKEYKIQKLNVDHSLIYFSEHSKHLKARSYKAISRMYNELIICCPICVAIK